MVFADIEYSGVVDELAAKAKAGGFEAHHEAPKTARLVSESSPGEDLPEDESENMDLEWEAHFEILTLDEGNTGLQILGTGLAGERNQKEPSIPDAEPGILIADPIGSATMDEHIQATISEDVDEPEAPVVLAVAEPEPDFTPTDSAVEFVSDDDPGASSIIDDGQNSDSANSLLDVDDNPEPDVKVVAIPGPAESESSSEPHDYDLESSETAPKNSNPPEAQVVAL